MMTSSNGNSFRVTGHLCGEFIGPRWIPRRVIWDATAPIMTSLQCSSMYVSLLTSNGFISPASEGSCIWAYAAFMSKPSAAHRPPYINGVNVITQKALGVLLSNLAHPFLLLVSQVDYFFQDHGPITQNQGPSIRKINMISTTLFPQSCDVSSQVKWDTFEKELRYTVDIPKFVSTGRI